MQSPTRNILILICCLMPALNAAAQDARDRVPDAMQDVGVDEKLGAQLPLDTVFTNELGRKVTLRECIISGKPAVMQLGYFGCPMLCDLISQGMLKSMQGLGLDIGRDFSVINISFDPRETTSDAYLKKKGYVQQYERGGAGEGWHFLTGDSEAIKAVTDAVGFKYKWVEPSQQFSHPAVLMVVSPEGRVSRYLYGVEYPQQTLRLSLVEASQGKIGSTVDRAIMLCFKYDASQGKYTLHALVLMRLAGLLTVIVLAAILIRQFVKERRTATA